MARHCTTGRRPGAHPPTFRSSAATPMSCRGRPARTTRGTLVALACTAVLGLAGCGSGDGQGGDEPPSSVDSPSTAATPGGTDSPESASPETTSPDLPTPVLRDEWIRIEGGWLVDVIAGERIPNPGVVISPDGLLHRVGDDGPPLPDDARPETLTLDEDQTVLPGLVDVHAHYNMDLTGDGRIEETRWNPLIFLANGVTTTWPAGEYRPELMATLEERLESGAWVGPRLIRSGPYYGSTRPGWNRDITREELHADVDEWVARGVLHFKAKGASPQHLEWLIERVHEHGGTVTGHVDSGARGSTNSEDAIAFGIDRIEHILGGPVLDREQAAYPVWNQVDTTSAEFREAVRLFLDNEVFFDPTLTAPVYFTELEEGFDDWGGERDFFTPHIRERVAERERTRNELMSNLYQAMQRSTLAFYNAGGGPWITMGTDLPSGGEFLPGFAAHRELHTMVLAGIPPIDALRAGTINGARALRMEDDIGSITSGKRADLFVVRGDPLAEIRATRNVEMVVIDGVVWEPAALLEPARGRIGPEGPDEHADWWRW